MKVLFVHLHDEMSGSQRVLSDVVVQCVDAGHECVLAVGNKTSHGFFILYRAEKFISVITAVLGVDSVSRYAYLVSQFQLFILIAYSPVFA